jgi:hypothetical protein
MEWRVQVKGVIISGEQLPRWCCQVEELPCRGSVGHQSIDSKIVLAAEGTLQFNIRLPRRLCRLPSGITRYINSKQFGNE